MSHATDATRVQGSLPAEAPAGRARGPAAFDNEKYLAEQTAAILQRVDRFHNKLYLEFGGKLLFDYHAARVLPGFDPNVKMSLLQKLKDQADIILCIYAGDIERRKVRADFGITYDSDAFKLIDDLRDWGLDVLAVVITRFDGQPGAVAFRNKLQRRGIPAYTHAAIRGYPADVDLIVSPQGYGANEYVETSKPLVVVTGPGPNSGKMATCLSQVYHEHQRGLDAGYAKFETFPIWNLPLRHPVNVAYEAATADIRDFNIIDPFHLEAHNERAVNYNRDVEAFPVLRTILERITESRSPYQSPTDMGVNRAGFAITDDAVVRHAATQEIIRRYFRYSCEYAMGLTEKETVQRVEVLMKELDVSPTDRSVVEPARRTAAAAQERGVKGHKGVFCGAAIKLGDGTIITGLNSSLMHAASSLVLNAAKRLAGIPESLHLLSDNVLESIAALKQNVLRRKTVSLDLEETLIALSICSTTNPTAKLVMEQLKDLHGCEVHMTHIPAPGDETGLRRLGVNLTCDPGFATKNLFVG
ncbi:MAG TPA: DUF1846 domain-containing protein [Phycisphaerae bacterium]|nr:DUF1846 domain-containing protein [Phycisphaerae bacterium]